MCILWTRHENWYPRIKKSSTVKMIQLWSDDYDTLWDLYAKIVQSKYSKIVQ